MPEFRLEYDLFLKSINPFRRLRELAQELRRTREERDQVRRRNEQLEEENERLEKESQRLQEKIKKLRKELETAQRAGKRQAAPFSRGKRQNQPKSPGRKPGKAYGQHYRRPIPDHVDESIAVAVPEKCPACSGTLTVERIESQYQEEIVRCTRIRRFDIPMSAASACRGAIRCKPPMPSGRRRCR